MSSSQSVDEYVFLMTHVLQKFSERARPEYSERLAAEIAWLSFWSSQAERESKYTDLIARHRSRARILGPIIESMAESDLDDMRPIVREKLQRANALIDDFENPRVVQNRMQRVSDKERPDLCRPIFLISSWRSGSTLLMALLGAHKNLVALPEANLLDSFLVVGAEGTRNARPILYRRRPPIVDVCHAALRFGVQDTEVFEQFSAFIDSLVSGYVRQRGGKRWVYKETANFDSLDLIDLLFGGRAHFIWLIRHGLDVVNSEIERYERRGVQCADLSEYAREWAATNKRFADFCDRMPGRCIRVRYEDFVLSPESEARRMLEFVGESWDSDIFDNMSRSSDVLGGDHKYTLSAGIVDPSRTGRWKQWPEPFIRQFGEIVNPMLNRVGYERIL